MKMLKWLEQLDEEIQALEEEFVDSEFFKEDGLQRVEREKTLQELSVIRSKIDHFLIGREYYG